MGKELEVKYVPDLGGDSKMFPGKVVTFKSRNGRVSLLLSASALAISMLFVVLGFSWMWGVPQTVLENKQRIEALEETVGEQDGRIDRIINGGGGGGGKRHRCSLGKEFGDCSASIPRWFMNPESGACEQFDYSGCGGNENNFNTYLDCHNVCDRMRGRILEVPDTTSTGPGCNAEPQVGPCRAAIQRWFFDKKTRTCKTFLWGGCDENGNNFSSEENCKTRCGIAVNKQPERDQICSLPKDMGRCRAAIERFYFEPSTGSCESFLYGGCEGNENNFETLEDCKKLCLEKLPSEDAPLM